jgi:hypothetical protein
MVDRPWTAAPSSSELRPPAVPVSKGAGQGVGEEEWNEGARWAAHRGVGGSVAAGRRGGAVVVGGARWGGAPAWERRRGKLGEGRDVPGVLGGAFLGAGWRGVVRGERQGGVAGVTAALMALTPLKAGVRLRGGRIKGE